MTPFGAFLWSMFVVLVLGAGVVYAIYRQKRNRQ
ncbi:hypothetical protein Glov_2861 [Trichlorobacter lovleyi SZ]|jgi:hypothetical protein|uniref:Uncharacterized protein n=1 Tax=Trichlorobacter lovleyi (strain ATCC BAA-1151 / DSM 17278 / SZ) TaxID=398767 RepID=B3E801_TRIL1|nr:hypothetical protein Glov_2861 [Trichlorobacter lovleyi SZ]